MVACESNTPCRVHVKKIVRRMPWNVIDGIRPNALAILEALIDRRIGRVFAEYPLFGGGALYEFLGRAELAHHGQGRLVGFLLGLFMVQPAGGCIRMRIDGEICTAAQTSQESHVVDMGVREQNDFDIAQGQPFSPKPRVQRGEGFVGIDARID